MKTLLSHAACWLALFAPARSASAGETVALPHDWPVGTRYHVDHTYVREEFAAATGASTDTAPISSSSTTTPIDVEVIARRTDGYTLRWTYGLPKTATTTSMPPVLADGMLGLVEGLVMELETDASGSVVRLANRSDMERHFAAASERLVANLRGKRVVPEAQIAHLATTLSGLRGDALEAAYAPIARTFYLSSGVALTPGERKTWDDMLPNPFGGDPLPSVSSIELRSVDRAAGRARVEWRRSLDPAKAGPILEAAVRARARRAGQELPADAALQFDAVEDAASWTYDLATGVPVDYVTTRATTNAGVRRIDTHRIVVRDFRRGAPATPAEPPPK